MQPKPVFRRMNLTPSEQEIIQGLRQQAAIWNEAIAAVLVVLHKYPPVDIALENAIMELRK